MDINDYFYAWKPALFRKRTRGMNIVQRGIYRELIDEYMLTREPLPADDLALADIARISIDIWNENKAAVLAKFEKVGEFLHHEHCDGELEFQDRSSVKKSKDGKTAASKRWEQKKKLKMRSVCDDDATTMPDQCELMQQDRTGQDKERKKEKKVGRLDRPEPTAASETDQPTVQPKFISGEDFSRSIPATWSEWAQTISGFSEQEIIAQARKLSDLIGTSGNVTFAQWKGWIGNEIEFRQGNQPAAAGEAISTAGEVLPALAGWQAQIAKETGEQFCRIATADADYADGILTVRKGFQRTMLEQRAGDLRRAGIKEIRMQT